MKKILVVDDDPELREKLSSLLNSGGYNVDVAATGSDALVKAKSVYFDVVLLDYWMPSMDGMDTLVELRRVSPKTKVIMITAFAQIDKAVEAIKKGATDYIAKPFKFEELLTVIRMAIEEARFEDGITQLDLNHALSALSQPIRRKIVRLLTAFKGLHYMDIARELQLKDYSKTAFHLRKLREAGIIDQSENRLYSLTTEGEKVIKGLDFLEEYLSR